MARVYHTPRLTIRPWKDADRAPFAALNADTVVMEYFPAPLSRSESDSMIARIEADFARHGFGFWAVETRVSPTFIGLVGLSRPRFESSFTPCVEIAWRLARESWGKGYATEAAAKVLEIGFTAFDLQEIVSFTVPQNRSSRRVMEKIGMLREPLEDFIHPNLNLEHPLSKHVLYRISEGQWRSRMT